MEKVINFLKKNKTKLGWGVLTLAFGGIGALIAGNTDTYDNYIQPPLSPPGWLFPVVWTVLYILMGIAAGLIAESVLISLWKVHQMWQRDLKFQHLLLV